MFSLKYSIGISCLVSMLFVIATGCSGVSDSVTPDAPRMETREPDNSLNRVLWGYYQIYVDPSTQQVEISPLRQTAAHLNALQYMETSTSTLVTLESLPQFGDGKVIVDIGLTHPLPQKRFTGFDVRGVVISRGSIEFDAGYIFPGPGDFRLLNPDGYSRFWNPSEFLDSGYQDGILGLPHSIGQFNATVNGFKYFANGLGIEDPLIDYSPVLRGVFGAGQKLVRKYELKIGDSGLMFNYAVDASWSIPDGMPPSVPDDFDIEKANCNEAWLVVPRLDESFSPGGWQCDIEVDVYDWQGITSIDGVYVQAPDIFDGEIELHGPVDNGDYYTYSGTFSNDNGADGADIPVLIRVRDQKAGTNPYLEAFQLAYVSITADVVITLEEDEAFKTPGTDYSYAQDSFELSVVTAPYDYLSTTGPWDMTGFDSGVDAHKIIYAPDANEVSTFVNDFPPEVEYFVRDPGVDGYVYRAEEHDEVSGDLILYGMHSLEDFNGSVDYDPVAHFPYPLDMSTDYVVNTKVTVFPVLLVLEFEYHTVAVGQGFVKAPYDGGTWYNCLYLRTTIDMVSTGSMGQGWEGCLLHYEWVADDGTLVGQILTGNDVDVYPNYDPDTFEITGNATFLTLKDIS